MSLFVVILSQVYYSSFLPINPPFQPRLSKLTDDNEKKREVRKEKRNKSDREIAIRSKVMGCIAAEQFFPSLSRVIASVVTLRFQISRSDLEEVGLRIGRQSLKSAQKEKTGQKVRYDETPS